MSQFAAGPPPHGFGRFVDAGGQGLYVDPATNDLYVDEGNQITEFNSAGQPIQAFGAGQIFGSEGVAVDSSTGTVYASDGVSIAVFKAGKVPPDRLVTDSVNEPGAGHTSDFQVSPSGAFAAFPSSQSLATGSETGCSHPRSIAMTPRRSRLDCASCAPTGAVSAGDASMAADGLSLTEDGRVFFDSSDVLAARDENRRVDVYEWEMARSV